MNLALAFEKSVLRNPQKTAIFWGESKITYEKVLEQARTVASQLLAKGVKPGDRVCVYLKNRPEYMPAFLGVLFAQGVVVPINNFLKPDEILYLVDDSGAKVLIGEASSAEGPSAHSQCVHRRRVRRRGAYQTPPRSEGRRDFATSPPRSR